MASAKTSARRPQTYDPAALSGDEGERLLAALGDGFGYSHRSQHLESLGLPAEVEPGLLKHRAYYYKYRRSEYFGDSEEDEFWEEPDGDFPTGTIRAMPHRLSPAWYS
jgi:hypothetical protein